MKHIITFLIILFCWSHYGFAQKKKVQYNPGYDNKPFHLGFSLGFNKLDYRITPSKHLLFPGTTDSVYRIEPQNTTGIHLAIISDLRMGNHLNLRFLPGLIFGQRNLEYTMRDLSSDNEEMDFYTYKMKLPSIHIDMPISLKIRATRINNYRIYILAGMAMKYDLETKRVEKENTDYTIRQEPLDFYYEFGFGIDWYLVYFKLSTEIKLSFGLNNLLIHEPIEYSAAIEKLKSRMLIFSFHFE
ncbi:MAG: porin family protein [Bacteroidales bacterium]